MLPVGGNLQKQGRGAINCSISLVLSDYTEQSKQ